MASYQGSFSVFSTYVEMILWTHIGIVCMKCILHVCGGDPKNESLSIGAVKCSLHMWR